MKKAEKSAAVSWWSSLGLRHGAPPAPDTDYADMGTAFGLDASLAPPAGAFAEEDEPGRPPGDDAGPESTR